MEYRYKIIISNKSLYKEFELPIGKNEAKLGTSVGCDFRLHRDLFFEPIELYFIKKNNEWTLLCSDSFYISVGDSRKLMALSPKHGDLFTIRYVESNIDAFTIEFLIDFNNSKIKYERAISLVGCSSIRIGTDDYCQVKLKSTFVKDDVIELQKSSKGFDLQIRKATYGVYYNGSRAISGCVVKNGDFFSISDFNFYYKNDILWTEIRGDLFVNGLSYTDYPNPNNYPKFSRNTRIKTILNKEKVSILDPPTRPKKAKSNFLISLLPSLGMLLTSGLMATMGGGMVVFSLISGVMAILTALVTTIQNKTDFKKAQAERIEKYQKYIENKRSEISQIRKEERDTLETIYLDLVKEQRLFGDFSSDLFDRQICDDDFLHVRLGVGNVSSERKIEYKKQEKFEVEDGLQLLPEQISEEFSVLENAPVICNFKESGSVGIIGEEDERFSILKNIIIDICARQYYTDVQLFFIADLTHRERVSWLRFLPHVTNDILGTRNIAFDDESKSRVFDYLYNELSRREQNLRSNTGVLNKHIVVFFYDQLGFQTHPISKFAHKLNELAVTFVFMAEQKSEIPQGCSSLIFIDSYTKGSLVNSENCDDAVEFTFNAIGDEDAKKIVALLAPVYTEEISLEGALTKNISMFEMLNILVVDDIDLKHRWENSKVFSSMAAPIGVTKSEVISLDLHDKAHGPHGLVAGTTGSGKSEVLQTYILSISTLFHPYEVAFVIIDFKGGGMVNQFKNLPHLLGAITNIDGREIDRSLKSIKAELKKRQRLFAEAEVNHIDKYIRKFKEGVVSTPVPHLILIVDEFAELKAEHPDFMRELISAARIGRSLGVHLILATQKPSGQVDDQIWSNSRFKLCLKVQSQEDSKEVLKSSLAAEIKEPGRAYLQVGNNEVFELFQSAYSGAPEEITDIGTKEFDIFEVGESGKRTLIYKQQKSKTTGNGQSQLEALVNYVNRYCLENNIERLPNICLPSLSSCIQYPEVTEVMNSIFTIGVYDDPDNQVQEGAKVDINSRNTIIIGSSQTGKTNILQSIIKYISYSSSPSESYIYIIDFASMVLKNFENLNHVGGVICSSDDEKLKNLVKLLFSEIAMRKEKMLSVGVSSYASYLEAGYNDLPRIYLLIDNLSALLELYFQDDDSLLNLLREGITVGITVSATSPQTAGIGYKYLSNFANKVALHCIDNSEYVRLFEHVKLAPNESPGRCILEVDKTILECQSYLAFEGEKEIDRVNAIKDFTQNVNSKNLHQRAKMIPTIPKLLKEEDLMELVDKTVTTSYSIPIGLTYSEVTPYYLELGRLGVMGLCGKENTGHKNFIDYIVNVLDSISDECPSEIVVLDDFSRKYSHLQKYNNVSYTLSCDKIIEIIKNWHSLLEERYNNLISGTMQNNSELLLLIIQNNDIAKMINDDWDTLEKFKDLVGRFKGMNIAVIFANYPNGTISYDAPEPIRLIKQEQHIIFYEDLSNLKALDVPYEEIRNNKKKLETGDGYYILENSVVKLKLVKAKT